MSKITPAAEALRLPTAQLSQEENDLVDKICKEINDGINKGMKRNGFEFTTSCANGAVVFEVVSELQSADYMVQIQMQVEQPRFQGAQPTVRGYTLTCMPTKEAVTASKRMLLQ